MSSSTMNSDDATRAWLKQELVALLGFPEVDDILNYVLSEFKTPAEVEPYLTELLGVAPTRAQAISARLFRKPTATKTPPPQAKSKPTEQSAAPLVPVPSAPNSRLKQAKSKKPSKLLHARIINCLQCGRIELNGARRCAFCDAELRYEELDGELVDAEAQRHMQRLVALDESGAARTTVLDTEQEFYDQVQVVAEGERHRQPVVLHLNLDERSFERVEAPALVLTANQELTRDARELLQSLQKKLTKNQKAGIAAAPVVGGGGGVVLEDEYNALYV